MNTQTQIAYLEYTIIVTEEGGRFIPRVTRANGMIEHDGHASQAWSAASCASLDRAVLIAKTAIDSDRIR